MLSVTEDSYEHTLSLTLYPCLLQFHACDRDDHYVIHQFVLFVGNLHDLGSVVQQTLKDREI